MLSLPVDHSVDQAGWAMSLYPSAGEGSAIFRSARPDRVGNGFGVPGQDPVRSGVEAARRAKGKVRRFCAANRLNRLGTLTYAGEGCHDPRAVRDDVAEFFRSVRSALGVRALPYLWVAELHPGGHGFHIHFAVGQYVPRSVIQASWRHGFVHIKLIGDLPVGSGTLAESRKAAGYLSKYVAKAFHAERIPGLHRYEVAQGFQPKINKLWGRTSDELIEVACGEYGAQPSYIWRSSDTESWQGPPAMWLSWLA